MDIIRRTTTSSNTCRRFLYHYNSRVIVVVRYFTNCNKKFFLSSSYYVNKGSRYQFNNLRFHCHQLCHITTTTIKTTTTNNTLNETNNNNNNNQHIMESIEHGNNDTNNNDTNNNNIEMNDNSNNNNEEQKTTKNDINIKTIIEGSCHMIYPANDDCNVFYNPVQVQNRDLSIIMISLYIERYALRQLEKHKKMELKQQNAQKKKDDDGLSLEQPQQQQKSIQEQVNEYMKTISGSDAVQWMKEHYDNDDNNNTNDTNDQTATTHNNSTNNGGISILDALAASGLRSIRYWKEMNGINHITINDYEKDAITRAHGNIQNNKLQDILIHQRNQYGIRINHNDAIYEMYNSRPNILIDDNERKKHFQPYHVIDLDPYGSASSYLDAAIQGLHEHGMLCVTCTDMVALGGSHPETSFGRYYGSMPIPHSQYLQEMAIRILLYTLSMTAAKYGKIIKPILSVGMNFYIRVFVEISTNKAEINHLSINKIGSVYQSTQCPSYYIVPAGQLGGKNNNSYQPGRMPMISTTIKKSNSITTTTADDDTTTSPAAKKNDMEQTYIGSCQETGSTFKIGGPIWIGPLHDKNVIKDAIERLENKNNQYPNMKYITTTNRIYGLLTSCYEELIDIPLYYQLPSLAKTLHISTPPIQQIRNAIYNAGYHVSGYHKEPSAIKTNASNQVIWDILKHWIKIHPPKKPIPINSIAYKILAIPPVLTNIDFITPIPKAATTITNSTDDSVKVIKVTRFPMNPERNWGPKPAATKKNKKKMVTTTETTTSIIPEENNNKINDSSPPIKKPKI